MTLFWINPIKSDLACFNSTPIVRYHELTNHVRYPGKGSDHCFVNEAILVLRELYFRTLL